MISSTVKGTSIMKILAEAKSRRMWSPSRNTATPAAGRVGADALEDARAVVHGVGEHVHRGVGPVDELAVHPDLLGRGDGHCGYSLSAMASPTAVVDSCSLEVGRSGFDMASVWAATRLHDAVGGVALAEVLEHERGRVDGGQRVGDALARDVVGGAVHRLEQRRARSGPG